jgi:tight adherence protein B
MLVNMLVFIIAFCAILAGVFLVFVPLRDSIKRAGDREREKMTRKLDDMFVFIPVDHLLTLKLVASAIGAAAAFFLCFNLPGWTPYVTGVIGAVAGFFSPELVVKWMKRRRQKLFADQLVDSLIMLSNGLKAGFTLQQAVEMVAQEGKPPISQEFELVLREFHFGVDLETALVNSGKRVRNDDFDLAVTAISICRQVGGNLPEIFDRIVTMVRDRKLIEGKVDALTAQGRLQALIVALLPWVFAFFCTKINPELMQLLWTTVPGILAMALAVTLDVAGYFWVRRLSMVKY